MKVTALRRTHATIGFKAVAVLMTGCAASTAFAQANSDPGSAAPAVGETQSQQPVPAGPAANSENGQLQEIIVTAERREQNLQNVPMAIAALTSSQVSSSGVIDPFSLPNLVPGLNFDRQGPASTPFIRGVGSPIGQPGNEPSVAYYVDDVYYSSPSGSLSGFNDISRIEVEKGPQGTLFGRNATGGVVQVFTKDPTRTPTLDISAGYANYNTPSGSLYGSTGLTSTLAANIALYGSDQLDGWGKNLATGKDVFRTIQYGGRIKLLWTPGSRTTVLLSGDYDRTATDVGSTVSAIRGTQSGVPGTPAFAFTPPKNFYDINEDLETLGVAKQGGGSLKVTHDLGWAHLTSITAGRSTVAAFSADEDISPNPLVLIHVAFHDREFTQELRLGSEPGSAIKWTAGLFYFNDRAAEGPLVVAGPITAPLPDGFITNGIETTNSFSAYGEATATILPDTHLTLGARYTIDHRRITGSYELPEVEPKTAAPNAPQSVTYRKPTFRVALDHQLGPNNLIYAAFNRGFKSGVYNPAVSPATPIAAPVKPEQLDAWTIGVKNEFFDRRLRANIEGFYYNYKDIQVERIVSGSTVFSNAATATIKGIDVDLQAIPIRDLTLGLSAEYLDGRYDKYPGGTLNIYVPGQGIEQVGSDLSGNRTIESPPFTFSASANYKIPTANSGTFGFDAVLARVGDFYFEPDNSEGQLNKHITKQPLVYLLNLSVDWTSPDNRFDVSLFGRNVTGRKYYSQILSYPFGAAGSPASPATFGIKGTVHFGG